MSIRNELKKLEKEEARLARQKKQLEDELKKKAEESAKLQKLVKSSGYSSAKELVDALVDEFGLRRPRGTGAAAAKTGRRKRTKVTPELRDRVKKDIKGGMSMNQASKNYEISYAVIAKINNGAYDSLK